MRKHFYKSQEHLSNSEYRFNFEKHYFATSEFLATDTEVPGSIPGATRFSE